MVFSPINANPGKKLSPGLKISFIKCFSLLIFVEFDISWSQNWRTKKWKENLTEKLQKIKSNFVLVQNKPNRALNSCNLVLFMCTSMWKWLLCRLQVCWALLKRARVSLKYNSPKPTISGTNIKSHFSFYWLLITGSLCCLRCPRCSEKDFLPW